MKKRIYYLILLEMLIVLMLTTAWEFWLEDFTFGVINVDHAEEDLTERLEYSFKICVLTIFSFQNVLYLLA